MTDILIASFVSGTIGVFIGVLLVCLVSANGRDE